jgi:hypothetical protein
MFERLGTIPAFSFSLSVVPELCDIARSAHRDRRCCGPTRTPSWTRCCLTRHEWNCGHIKGRLTDGLSQCGPALRDDNWTCPVMSKMSCQGQVVP